METQRLKDQLLGFGLRDWDGQGLLLVPLALFAHIPNGAALTSISDEVLIKGKDSIDEDTRGGFLAFGVIPEQYEEALEWFDTDL